MSCLSSNTLNAHAPSHLTPPLPSPPFPPPSPSYVRVRSWTAPFAIVGQVCQATCLTAGDVRTPAIAVLAASLINVVLDLALCVRPFNYGIAGAAFATSVANVASTAVLYAAVYRSFFRASLKAKGDARRGPLQSLRRAATMMALPSLPELGKLASFCGTIFFVIVTK